MPETCEYVGHEWIDAGGGMDICALCEAMREQRFTPATTATLDVYGAKEAAAALGVSKARFHELRARPDFPKGTRLANGVVYRGEDIRAYAANRKAT